MNYDAIIDLAIRAAVIFLAGYILPKVKEWLKTQLEEKEYERLVRLITALVEAAEQTLKEQPGAIRKQYVISELKALEYDITAEVDALIEAAVYGINNGKL